MLKDFSESKVLFEDSDCRFTYHKSFTESDKVLVCFGEIDSSLEAYGFGVKAALWNDVNYLYVAQRKNTQYQNLSVDKFKSVICENFSEKEFFLFGSSLGGYCALYYSSSINAHALAFSPRIPSHPKVKKFMRGRYKDYGFNHNDLSVSKNSCARVVCFFDPYNFIDNYYFSFFVLPVYKECEYFKVDGAGHYSARALLLSGSLKSVVSSFLLGKEIHFKHNRAKLADWHLDKAVSRLEKRNFELARENIEALMYLVGYTSQVRDLLLKYNNS